MARRRTNGNGVDARRRAPEIYAALDLGTNNCRMLIAEPADDGFRVIDAFSRIVRLGEGVGARGVLSEAAMSRTIDALRVCASKMRRRGVTRARSIATEACRRASNCGVFIDRVAAEADIDLEIISSREEARLALAGCLPLLDGDAPRALMFDIGGGSTELIWLDCGGEDDPAILDWMSLPCGVVNLAEAHGGDRVSPGEYAAMVEHIDDLLAPFETKHRIARDIARGGVQMLGSSGTVTTMAAVHLELPRYERSRVDGIRLDFTAIDAVAARLKDLDCAGRAAIPSIGPERADLVVAGCAILEAIQRLWPVGSLRVADRGVREGMLNDMMHGNGNGDQSGTGEGRSARGRTTGTTTGSAPEFSTPLPQA